jgi:hypothetical protein
MLYHMAQAGTWLSIHKLGLLSTTALLDLFEINGDLRLRIESTHRPKCVEISHPVHGTAVIRDQKPMSEKALLKCLLNMSPRQWYELLNRRVFLWVTEQRVLTLLGARAYKNNEHLVMTIDTARLMAKYSQKTELSPINSGSTVYNPQPRGRATFASFDDFPYAERRKYGKGAVAELTIDYSIPDIKDFVLRAEVRKANKIVKVL